MPSTIPLGRYLVAPSGVGHAKRTDEFAFQLPEGALPGDLEFDPPSTNKACQTYSHHMQLYRDHVRLLAAQTHPTAPERGLLPGPFTSH